MQHISELAFNKAACISYAYLYTCFLHMQMADLLSDLGYSSEILEKFKQEKVTLNLSFLMI